MFDVGQAKQLGVSSRTSAGRRIAMEEEEGELFTRRESMRIGNWTCLLALGVCFGLAIAVSPAIADDDDENNVTVVNLNILHGFACDPAAPDDGDHSGNIATLVCEADDDDDDDDD